MGLDMYLERYPRMGVSPRTVHTVEGLVSWARDGLKYSFKDWCGYSSDDLPEARTLTKLMEMIHTTYYVWDKEKRYPNDYIHDQVGYWRKANAIHNWFVENVQDGEDDCDYHRPLTRQDLKKLAEQCRIVLDDHSKASDVLPVAHGFFFGSYEYDDWYFNEIEKTEKLCKRLMDEFDFGEYELYYKSSW